MMMKCMAAPQARSMKMKIAEKEVLMDICDFRGDEMNDILVEQRKQYQEGYKKLKKTIEYVER